MPCCLRTKTMCSRRSRRRPSTRCLISANTTYVMCMNSTTISELRHNCAISLKTRQARCSIVRWADKMVPELTQSEATLSLRYAPGEKVVVTKQRRHPVNHNYPIYTLMHTTGFKDVLGGDYASNYTELSVTKAFLVELIRAHRYLRSCGAQWNRVPFPLLITPAANNSYIIQRSMFNMINNMEFMNDRFVSLDVQWDLSGKLFNRIPLLKHLKWREVIGFKTLYGTFDGQEQPLLNKEAKAICSSFRHETDNRPVS